MRLLMSLNGALLLIWSDRALLWRWMLRQRLKRQRRRQMPRGIVCRSEEHTSELQSLMRISYAVFCLKKNNTTKPASQARQGHETTAYNTRMTLHTYYQT